jgi:hypothetical protein
MYDKLWGDWKGVLKMNWLIPEMYRLIGSGAGSQDSPH